MPHPRFLSFYDNEAAVAVHAGTWFDHLIAGVSHPAPDGTDRQWLARGLTIGQELYLLREKENPEDPNAIGLRDQYGRHCGFVSAKAGEWFGQVGGLAATLAPRLDAGEGWRCFVRAIVGGRPMYGAPSVGVRIFLVMTKGAYFEMSTHAPLGEYEEDEDHMPLRNDSFALAGDLIRVWDLLTPDQQAKATPLVNMVLRWGGCPEAEAAWMRYLRDQALAAYAAR